MSTGGVMTDPTAYNMRRYSFFQWGVFYLRTKFPGMSVTSWGRSPAHNEAVGGKPDSQHLFWTAADVVWDPGTRPELPVLQAVAAEWGLEVDREPDHDHVEIARGYV